MWVHRRPGDVPGWGAALGTGAAAAALTLARPPAALDGRGSTAVATAAVVAGTLVALAHRHRARYAVVIPGLVMLLLVAVLADAGPLAMLMLFELLFVGTLEARGVWRWCAWSVAGAVTVATIAAAVHQVVGQDHVMVLALQNVVLSGLAVWWAQNLRRMREQTQKVAAGSIAQELAARHERQASEARSALAVSAERVRLARDMHDIVAGRLAAVSLQASLAMRADDPGQVARAVREIKACADATLGEVRAMIDELGADGSTTPDLAECRRRLDGEHTDECQRRRVRPGRVDEALEHGGLHEREPARGQGDDGGGEESTAVRPEQRQHRCPWVRRHRRALPRSGCQPGARAPREHRPKVGTPSTVVVARSSEVRSTGTRQQPRR